MDSYWRRIHKRAVKKACADLRITSWGEIVHKIILPVSGLFVLWALGAIVLVFDKIYTIVGSILILPLWLAIFYCYRFVWAPAQLDAEARAEIAALSQRIDAMSERAILHRSSVTFGEVADDLARGNVDNHTRDDILHRLFRAMWRGEFEDDNGRSRLMLPRPARTSHSENGPYYSDEKRNRVASPPLREWPRKDLLLSMPPVPGIPIDKRSFRVDDFVEVLCSLRPHEYDSIFREANLENLIIQQSDFRRWYERYRAYAYEK